jgi:uncharacterized protein (TIGR00255 family)
MTAYGRAVQGTPLGQWTVEIHSVNRKMLDISVYLPKELLRFDKEVRTLISNSIYRGQITVRIYAALESLYQDSLAFLKELKNFWEKTSLELGFDPKQVTLSFLMEQIRLLPHQGSLKNEKEIETLLCRLITEALVEVQEMKEREGHVLGQDIIERLHAIETALEKVLKRNLAVISRHRQKLEEKLKEFSLPSGEIETRLLQEIGLLAEKLDITEEGVRLHSHIKQFLNHMQKTEKSIGRTLDFLLQEMYREINTIGVKSPDTEISEEVVFMKSEHEKIREQVQNIE